MTLEIATIERARFYLNTDAPFLALIRKNSGLTAETVHQIASEYLVRRNIGSRDELLVIANHLNTEIASWPGDLTNRAAWCLTQAAAIKKQLNLHHTPFSAVTKLAWFLRPDGWTLYDSFARKAIKSGGIGGIQQVTRFYKVLGEQEFLDAATKIDQVFSGTAWSHLSGVRVLDAYMMWKGGYPFRLTSDAARKGFLDALPGTGGQELSTLAARITTDLAQHNFIKFVEQR